MATKKQNRRHAVRRQRRALNRVIDFFTKITGRRLNRHRYGAGVHGASIKQQKETK